MAKFNLLKKDNNFTKNKEGFVVFKMEEKEKLATMVFTTMFREPKFYGDNSSEIVDLAKNLIAEGQGRFVANMAVFARNEMNLRSVSHALCAILAGEEKGKEFVRYATAGVCQRADDILEVLSCYLNMYGKPVANSLKKALGLAMNKFDEYQFGKYKSSKKALNFKDVLRITHAKAKNEEQNRIFKAILEENLKTPYTWETELSAKGNTKEVWEELIDSGKVGDMALLRNLNNILNAQPKNATKVYKRLIDEKSILRNKILPFRYYSAYKTIEKNPNCSSIVLDCLEEAIATSTQNIEHFKGKTCIAIDVSGSMICAVSRRSEISCADVATLLASMANYICDDAIVLSFDNNLRQENIAKRGGIISNAKAINVTGGGTSIGLPILHLLTHKIKVDRIIMLSDYEINQQLTLAENLHGTQADGKQVVYKKVTCQQLLEQYMKEVNPNVYFHGVDLQGYGTQVFKGKNVNILAGWNERVFEFMHLAEQGFGNLVKIIEDYNEVSEYADVDAEG